MYVCISGLSSSFLETRVGRVSKGNTCFKGEGSCIDQILTNRKYSFKHSNSVETGISDHYHLSYTMPKITFSKAKPKLVHYRKYKTLKVLTLAWEML